MMISKNVKEFLKWSSDMNRRIELTEQEEIESEKSPNREIQNFVLQTRKYFREFPALKTDREICSGTIEDEASKN